MLVTVIVSCSRPKLSEKLFLPSELTDCVGNDFIRNKYHIVDLSAEKSKY